MAKVHPEQNGDEELDPDAFKGIIPSNDCSRAGSMGSVGSISRFLSRQSTPSISDLTARLSSWLSAYNFTDPRWLSLPMLCSYGLCGVFIFLDEMPTFLNPRWREDAEFFDPNSYSRDLSVDSSSKK